MNKNHRIRIIVVFVFEVLRSFASLFICCGDPPPEVQYIIKLTIKVETHRTSFDNAAPFLSSLTDNFDPGLSFPNI
jgi:hypothetical protein